MNPHVDKLLAQLVLVVLAFILLAAAGRVAWRVADDLAYVESLRRPTTATAPAYTLPPDWPTPPPGWYLTPTR